jgi:hypothetical protein
MRRLSVCTLRHISTKRKSPPFNVPWRHKAGVEIAYSATLSARSGWPTPRPNLLHPGCTTVPIEEGLLGPRPVWTGFGEEKIPLPWPRFEFRTTQPVESCYTDYLTPATYS